MVCSARPMASVSRLRIAAAGARSSRKSTCDSVSRAGNEATWVPRGRGLTEFQMAHEPHASVAIMHNFAARCGDLGGASPAPWGAAFRDASRSVLAIRGLRLGRFDGDAHLHPSGLE